MLRWLLLFSAVLLAACGTTTGAAPAPDLADALDINLAELPEDVSVTLVSTLQTRDDVVVIDVREQWEYDNGHIPGVMLIPLSEFDARLDEIPNDQTVIFACESGARSKRVTSAMKAQGHTNVHNMVGGFSAWERANLPVEQ